MVQNHWWMLFVFVFWETKYVIQQTFVYDVWLKFAFSMNFKKHLCSLTGQRDSINETVSMTIICVGISYLLFLAVQTKCLNTAK